MCEPATLAILATSIAAGAGTGVAAAGAGAATATAIAAGIGVGATIAGGATTAYSQYQSGQYQAKVAANNAMIQERLAEDALQRGDIAEQRHRQSVAQFQSQQRAAMGASGIDLGSGSASDILADTSMMGELDALTIRSNAEREAWSRRVGAQNYRAQGRLARTTGRNQAIGTILSTGGKVAGQWYQMGGATPSNPYQGMGPVGTNYGGWTP